MYKNKISNNDIRNIIIITLVLIIYSILTKDYNIYLLSNNIITIAMAVVFLYVNIIRTIFVDKTFMKGFVLAYLMLIIIIILNIIGFMALFEHTPTMYFIFLFSIQATLECCEIENFLRVSKSSLKGIIICIGYFILLLMLFYVFKVNYRLSNDHRLSFFIGSIVVSVLVSIGTFVSTLENMVSSKSAFSIDEFGNITFYMLSILIHYVGLLCILMGHEQIAGIAIFIKCFTFYKFYTFIIRKILDSSLERINNNIEIATKTKKELNSILKKRNAVLNEVNIMLQKSQDKNNELIDSIYGGVYLFYNDKLQYINKKTLGTVNIDSKEALGMKLSEFIKKYFNITLEDLKDSQNYIPFVKMKHTKLEVEIFLTDIDGKSKILYVHDISEINEHKKIRKVLEEYLEEEEIKKEFFANISHELKTPINLIFTALQVNEIYLKENNIDGLNKNRKIIKQNCLRLIEQLIIL